MSIASIKPMNTSQLALKSNPLSITNYTDGNVHEMYIFNHEATEQTPALTDYRYIGNDPYNYVYFNCDDLNNQNSETCEVWRIIGVFDVERTDPNDDTKTITERRMKLVKGNSIKNDKWNKNGDDNWISSTLNVYLNGEYYNNTGSNNYELKESVRGIIDDAIYYLGGTKPYSVSTNSLYTRERGTDASSTSRQTSWEGKVALMYPSDEYMVYGKGVNEVCYSNPNGCNELNAKAGWIYNSNKIANEIEIGDFWFLTPAFKDGYTYDYLAVTLNGNLSTQYVDAGNYGVRPVVYLKSSIQIIGGEGTEQNPYTLSS